MKHGSLFSGIGGFDLASEWMGWENVFHCEWNPFGLRNLKYHFPKSISYNDITKTDFIIHRGTIDILTGGFPCQPYSVAGKRKGKEDERNLWPEMLRAIREIQPTWVIGENVSGLINWNGGMVFDEVPTDMEVEGYEVIPFILPAAGINAPHKRDRVWFIAYSERYANGLQAEGRMEVDGELLDKREGSKKANRFNNILKNGTASNSGNKGFQGLQFDGSPNKKGQKGRKQPSGSTSKCHQINNWSNFPTQSPVCSGNDGISAGLDGITFSKWRNESIKAAGNAIVPQVALQIFKAIEQFECLLNIK